MNNLDNMKEKVIKKYFKYNELFYDVRSGLITDGIYFIDRLLIDTQERKYFINNKEVTEDVFFKNIPDKKKYFENHTYMSNGFTVYNKHYKNTLSLHDCVEKYKLTLDDVDLFILKDVTDERFCHVDNEGEIIIPTMDWVE